MTTPISTDSEVVIGSVKVKGGDKLRYSCRTNNNCMYNEIRVFYLTTKCDIYMYLTYLTHTTTNMTIMLKPKRL